MSAVPIHRAASDGEHKPDSVQKRAHLHPVSVQKVAKGEHMKVKKAKPRGKAKSSRVVVSKRHPGYTLAHRLGVPESHVQILDEHLCSFVLWNHPAPWPGESR